jgi:hypothetical protein
MPVSASAGTVSRYSKQTRKIMSLGHRQYLKPNLGLLQKLGMLNFLLLLDVGGGSKVGRVDSCGVDFWAPAKSFMVGGAQAMQSLTRSTTIASECRWDVDKLSGRLACDLETEKERQEKAEQKLMPKPTQARVVRKIVGGERRLCSCTQGMAY